MSFVADDLGGWLVGLLADAGRKKLTTWVLGTEQERALRQAASAAVQFTARELLPESDARAEELAMVVGQVFREPVPGAPSRIHTTLLEELQAEIAGQLAVLDDADLTGVGLSSADVMGLSAGVVAEKLTGHLTREIMVRGSRGGALEPLATQLNHDVTHLQGKRLEGMIGQLADMIQQAIASHDILPRPEPGIVVSRLVSDWDAFQLGVHQAIAIGSAPGEPPPELPVYVERAHDRQLRKLLSTMTQSTMVVLIGGSSTGKTRAALEGVRACLPGWPLVRPVDSRHLIEICQPPARINLRTVLWLDETQAYLYGRDGPAAATALRGLLDRLERVVVLGTMWPDYHEELTSRPDRGEPDPYYQARELLGAARSVIVPESFTDDPAGLSHLHRLCERDARLAAARAAAGDDQTIIQVLAGGLELVTRYEHGTDPYRKAVITAAMDIRRLGYRSVIPFGLLSEAAAGYLTDAQRAGPREGWFGHALGDATQKVKGVAALHAVRIRPGVGDADGCQLADYLDQHARLTRADKLVPAAVWDALVTYAADPDDLRRLSRAAEVRTLYRHSVLLATPAAQAGDLDSADLLRRRLIRAGHRDEAYQILRAAADADVVHAMMALAKTLETDPSGDPEHWWRRAAEAGDSFAMWRLARLLSGEGTWATRFMSPDSTMDARLKAARHQDAEYWMLRAAEAGDDWAIGDAADHLKDTGREDQARQLLHRAIEAGDTGAMVHLSSWMKGQEAEALLRRAAEAGHENARTELVQRLERTGRADEAEEILRRASRAGDWYATNDLVDRLQDSDRENEAELVLREAARTGDTSNALERLVSELWAAGRDDEAEQALRDAAKTSKNKTFAVLKLADWLSHQALIDEAMQVLRDAATAGDFFAMRDLAKWVRWPGNEDEAEYLLRRAVGAGTPGATGDLVKFLEANGRSDEVEQTLRYALESRFTYTMQDLTRILESTGRQPEARRLERFGIDPGGRTANPW